MIKKVEISHKTVVFVALFIGSLWLLFLIRDIILELFLALLVMTVLNPYVTSLTRKNIPRMISVLISYVVLFLIVGFSVAAIIPSVIDQTASFINNLPRFMDNIGLPSFISEQIIQQTLTELGSLPAQIGKVIASLFSNVLGVVTVLVFAFYLLSERDLLDNQLSSIFGSNRQKEIERMLKIIEEKLGGWARAELLLMFVVGLANYLGLKLLGIPFALPLSVLAGLFEIIPYAGPILAAIPAILIGFGLSPMIGLAVAALAFLIQQLENYALVPGIMKKSAGVNPIITLIILAIGFRIGGVVGLIISVPIYISTKVILTERLLVKE